MMAMLAVTATFATNEYTPILQVPEYPSEAYCGGIEGRVVLRLLIAATGRGERVEAARWSGRAMLDRAVVAAVTTWRGTPARRGDRPVATRQLLRMRFQLR